MKCIVNQLAIADVYNKEGCDEYRKGEYVNAIDFYTEGIKVGCQDRNLSAILFTNRATVHFQLGEIYIFNSSVLFLSAFLGCFFIFIFFKNNFSNRKLS